MTSLKHLNCILLVEDDVVYNFLHEKLLNKVGFNKHIEVAINGKIALEYLELALNNPGDENHPIPELILLDINMPLMDGWEFLEAFNTLDKSLTKHISIVMVTSSKNPSDVEKASKIEFLTDFKSKPLTLDQLESIIVKSV